MKITMILEENSLEDPGYLYGELLRAHVRIAQLEAQLNKAEKGAPALARKTRSTNNPLRAARQRFNSLTGEQIEEAVALYHLGFTIREISARTGVSENNLARLTKQYPRPKRFSTLSSAHFEQVLERYENGEKASDIAAHMGLAHSEVALTLGEVRGR